MYILLNIIIFEIGNCIILRKTIFFRITKSQTYFAHHVYSSVLEIENDVECRVTLDKPLVKLANVTLSMV